MIPSVGEPDCVPSRGYSSQVLPSGEELVPLGEFPDDLIRRMPPALPAGHGPELLPALAGIAVAQHLDHYQGLSSTRPAGRSQRPGFHSTTARQTSPGSERPSGLVLEGCERSTAAAGITDTSGH
jgi:hypothetical protein